MIAVSSWRKCLFLKDYVDEVIKEDRFADTKIHSGKLLAAMKEDNVKLDGWNNETLARYLQVGRRLASPKVMLIMMQWESVYERNAFVDGINMLRGCIGATTTDDDLADLLWTLYLEQVTG